MHGDLCFDGLDDFDVPTYTAFARTLPDCELTDVDADIVQCVDEEEFDPCGEVFED